MEEVCERENLKAALRQVKANKGSPGVDGMHSANFIGGKRPYRNRADTLNGYFGRVADDPLGAVGKRCAVYHEQSAW
jgi:hypothetical protein